MDVFAQHSRRHRKHQRMHNEVYTASHNRPYSGPLPPPSVLIRLAVHSLAVLTTDNMHTAMTEHESRHLLYSIIIIIIIIITTTTKKRL